MSMISISRDDRIIGLQGSDGSNCYGFLTVIDMQKATGEFVLVGLHAPDLELANEQHVSEPFDQNLRTRNRGLGTGGFLCRWRR